MKIIKYIYIYILYINKKNNYRKITVEYINYKYTFIDTSIETIVRVQ